MTITEASFMRRELRRAAHRRWQTPRRATRPSSNRRPPRIPCYRSPTSMSDLATPNPSRRTWRSRPSLRSRSPPGMLACPASSPVTPPTSTPAGPRAARPNVIVVLTDDQTVAELTVHDARTMKHPRRPGHHRSPRASSPARSAAPRAPASSPASTRTTRRDRQRARLPGADRQGLDHLPLAPGRRLPHRPAGRFLSTTTAPRPRRAPTPTSATRPRRASRTGSATSARRPSTTAPPSPTTAPPWPPAPAPPATRPG